MGLGGDAEGFGTSAAGVDPVFLKDFKRSGVLLNDFIHCFVGVDGGDPGVRRARGLDQMEAFLGKGHGIGSMHGAGEVNVLHAKRRARETACAEMVGENALHLGMSLDEGSDVGSQDLV